MEKMQIRDKHPGTATLINRQTQIETYLSRYFQTSSDSRQAFLSETKKKKNVGIQVWKRRSLLYLGEKYSLHLIQSRQNLVSKFKFVPLMRI
jgi:hypothetical protein